MDRKLFLQLPLLIALISGSILGVWWGHSNLRYQERSKQEGSKESSREFSMLFALIFTARADGTISLNKNAAIMLVFGKIGYSQLILSQIKSALTALSSQPMDIHTVIQQYKNSCTVNQRRLLFECATFVASADGAISPQGKKALQTIYQELGL